MSKDLAEVPSDLKAAAVAYKRRLSSQFMPVDPSNARERVKGSEFQVTRKIDGVMACAFYRGGEVTLVGSGGKNLSAAPCAKSLGTSLAKAGVKSATVVCELYVPVKSGRPRVGDVIAAMSDEEKIKEVRLAPFDLFELEGEPPVFASYAEEHARLSEIFTDEDVRPVEMRSAKSYGEVEEIYREWVEGEGAEGLVIHSDQSLVWKLKPRHTVDVAVIGYTIGGEGVRDLLFAFQHANGGYHVVGAVGNGLSGADRASLRERLQVIEMPSRFVHTDSRGVAYKMVKPEVMLELSIGEFVAEDAEGRPKYNALVAFDPEKGWVPKGRVPGVSAQRAVFERVRDDKPAAPESVSLGQVMEICPFDAPAVESAPPAPSTLLFRRVFKKVSAGKLMVQKYLVWKTNKESDPRYPAYVYHYTDYSSGRKDPLKRDLRVSSTKEQIVALMEADIAANVKKGWVEA